MKFRKAQPRELPEVFRIYQDAIRRMEATGIHQWDDLYPSFDILKEDVERGAMYVGKEGKTIAAAFALSTHQDEEYKTGVWRYPDLPFHVIHRLCVHPSFQGRGVGAHAVHFIEETLKVQRVGAVRLDAFSGNPAALRL